MILRIGRHLLLLLAALAIIASAVFAAVAIVRRTVGSTEVARTAAELLSEELDPESARVRIGDVSGNPLRGLVIHDLRLDVRGASGAPAGEAGWMPLLIAPRVELRYEPAELLRGRPRIRALRLVAPTIVLPAPGGTWPRLKERRGPVPRRGGFGLAIDELRIEGATLTRAPGARARAEADSSGAKSAWPPLTFSLAAGLDVLGGRLAARIDSLAATAGDLPPVSVRGGVEVAGRRVTLERLDLRVGLSHAVVAGDLDLERGPDLRVTIDPLLAADLASALGAREFTRPGWVRGTLALDGPWRELRAAFRGEGALGADRVTGLTIEARARADALEIERFVLAVNGTPLRGAATIGRGGARAATSGTLVFEGLDVEEIAFLRELAWMPPGRMSGTLTIGAGAGAGTGGGRPFDLLVSGGDVGGFALYPGRFQGTIGAGGVIELASYEVTTHGAVIRGAGRVDPRGEISLVQDLQVDDLLRLGGMLGERRFGGRGDLHLELAGPVRAPNFSVDGVLDSLDAGPFHLAQVSVHVANGTIRPRFTCDLTAEAARGMLAGQLLDSLAVAFSYGGGIVTAEHFMAARGAAQLRGAGTVEFQREATLFAVNSLALDFAGLDFANAGPVRIVRRGSVWDFAEFRLRGEHGDLAATGVIDAAGATTDFEVSAHDFHLAALDAALGGGRRLGGTLDLRLDARGGGRSFELTATATVDSLVRGRFSASHLAFNVRLAGPTLTIERFALARGGLIGATGRIQFARAPAGFRDLPQLFTKEALAAATADLALSAPVLDLAGWHGLDPRLDRASGVVALTAALRGSLAAPDGTLELASERVAIGAREFAPVAVTGRLEDGTLVVAASRLGVFDQPLFVSGRTPVRLSLLALPALDREREFDLTVDLAAANLAVATLFTDRIAEADGRIDGQVRIGGTVAAPSLSGAASVADGRVVVRGREEVMADVTARIAFSGQRVEFLELTATDGGKGRLAARGVLDVTGARLAGYDVTLTLDQYEVGETGAYLATIDGTFTFKKGAVAGLAGLPNYSGTVSVRRLDYLREIVGGGRADEPGPSSWVGTFVLDLPRNAWIRNNDLEVELRGELTYERDVAGRIVLGRLETVRGRYDLVGHTFRITSGEVEFTNPEVIDPEVNVSAETRIPEARIFATITGTAADRQVVLSSDPDYDQGTLWRFLVPTDAEQVTSVALTPFMRDLERSLAREIPGISVRVESRTVEEGAEPTWGARVGTYVAPELFLSAYQGFSSGSAQDVSAEYELSRIAYLKGSVLRSGLAESRGNRDVDQQYTIDLNLRWEF